jgi:hypothetical protein
MARDCCFDSGEASNIPLDGQMVRMQQGARREHK